MMKRGLAVSLVLVVLASAGIVFGLVAKGEESFAKLMEGNKRFVSLAPEKYDLDAKRKACTLGQNPSAIVVACSDSRVAPEIIFDQCLGDVFVVRVAGNVLDPVTLGSIEYAAEHLHTPLLVILGHEKCGAVAATLDAKGKPEGNIGAIVRKIMPAVKKAQMKGGSREDMLNNAIRENVLLSQNYMLRKSLVLKHLIEKGELKVVTAMYHFGSGEVEILGAAAPAPAAPPQKTAAR